MRVLITGATGMIGSKITQLCHEKEIDVNYLTTDKSKIENRNKYKGFYWNPEQEEIDENCLYDVDGIIHLAGASIAEPWSKPYKQEIIKSRTQTAALLLKTLKDINHDVRCLISASAIGGYPSSLEKLYFEEDNIETDTFVGKVVNKWEHAADEFECEGLDIVKIRIGLVLAEEGGILTKIKKPIAMNLGAALGSGKQWQSWIHIDDVAGIFLYAIQHELTGTYNAIAPNPVTNKELTKEVASKMNKALWLPNVPKFVLKSLLGEMSQIVLSSQLVSSKKIDSTGYNFKFTKLSKALDDILK